MKIFTALVLSLPFCVFSLSAQPQISVGVRGGAGFAWMTHTNDDAGYFPLDGSPRIAFGGGVFAEMAFTKRFSLRAGLEYSPQGDGSIAAVQGYYDVDPMKRSALFVEGKGKLCYLTMPVATLWGWNIGQDYRFYAGAGVQPGYLLRSEISPVDNFAYAQGFPTDDFTEPAFAYSFVSVPDDVLPLTKTMPLTDAMRRFDLDVLALAGFSRSFGANTFHLEAGFNYGLLKVWKESDSAPHNLGCNIMLGYSRRLGK